MKRASPLLYALLLLYAGAGLMASSCQEGAANPGTAVVRTYYDALTRQLWEVRIDCRHPERPATVVPAAAAEKPEVRENLTPVVKEGSMVQIWRDGSARIRLSGIAIGSAPLNHPVQVKTLGQGAILWGVARGPESVELIGITQSWSTP